ncbi:hypothetical protein HQN90_20285 [Paenibacillus alba]|uniref:hypothetical protein n=1 Tax=Paenibacillus alba TaxID=1197127 RepID=UPI0015670D33|nr:hypothetical protein [Paenibacillus alba]NQX68467.1 hypothetical protein [Paenibacillus alba]
MFDLFSDPRPYLPDHRIWRKLLLIILDAEHKEISLLLQKRLWTIRSIGTVIQWSTNDVKLVPLIEPYGVISPSDGGWPDKQFFDEMAATYLKPYAFTVRQLLETAYREAIE